MDTLDLRDLDCPQPVLRVKEAIAERPNATFVALVSQAVQSENVARMARSLGASVEAEALVSGEHKLVIRTTEAPGDEGAEPELEAIETGAGGPGRAVVFVKNDVMGFGDDALGRILIKAFLRTLKSVEPLPRSILFVNAGVRLTTEGSEEIATLQELADRGVEIVTCGTCLDYYHKLDSLRVGIAGNMFDIVDRLTRAAKVISP